MDSPNCVPLHVVQAPEWRGTEHKENSMDYNDMTESEQDDFWKEVTWENAEMAADDIGGWRRETAKKLIEGIQDRFKRLGFGPVGTPAIAVYADELARLARLPYPEHDCPLPVISATANVEAAA